MAKVALEMPRRRWTETWFAVTKDGLQKEQQDPGDECNLNQT